MLAKLREIITAPVFDDEDKTRRAKLLHIILSIHLIVFPVLILLSPNTYFKVIFSGMVAGSLLSFAYMRFGRIHFASVVLSSLYLISLSIALYVGGSIRIPASAAIIASIVAVGLLLDARTVFIYAVLVVSVLYGIYRAETAGWLSRYNQTTTFFNFVAYVSTLSIVGVGVVLVHKSIQEMFRRVQQSERELEERNRELQSEIIERSRVEKELRESELKYRRVVENILDAFYRTNKDSRICMCSPSCARMFGYPNVEDFIGTYTPSLFMDEEDRDVLYSLIIENGVVNDYELMMKRRDGTLFYGSMSASILYDENGEFCGSEGIIRDVTERKRAQEALRQSEEKYRAIFKDSIMGIYQSTPEGRYLRVNPAFARMLGYDTPEQMLNEVTNIAEQLFLRPKDRQRMLQALDDNGMIRTYEIETRQKNGNVVWISVNAKAVRNDEGQVLYYEGTTEDITERKWAEEEIIRLNATLEQRVQQRTAELEAANSELEAFAYSVSHDLRAPLRSLDGFSQVLMEDYWARLDEAGRRYLGRVRAAAQRMGFMIDDLLKLSRITRGEMSYASVPLSRLVERIMVELQETQPERTVEWKITPDLVVKGDERLLETALTNLLLNAWKYTGKEISPRIEFGCMIRNGGEVFYVRDNGVGFDMAYSDKLFGAFQRLHSEKEFEGTGIGLAIAQRVIHRHGGNIWAESAPGEGATFYFSLGR